MKTVLGPTLQLAVWMWRMELAHLRPETLQSIARECSGGDQGIAYLGDVLQHKVKGKTSMAFNALAKGMAAASLVNRDDDWEARIAQLDASFSDAQKAGFC
jgi:hypothetical protein